MDALTEDFERTIPHIDDEGSGLDVVIGAGKKALRRRRAGAAAGLSAAALMVSALALNVTGPPNRGEVHSATSRTATAQTGRPTRPTAVKITLASLQKVADACEKATLDPATRSRIRGGHVPPPTDHVSEHGWVALEFHCGSTVIRVLERDGSSLVRRSDPGEGGTLADWAETNSRRLHR